MTMACERGGQHHPDDIRTGTTAGFYAHKAAGEPTCRPCRDAMTAKSRHYRQIAITAAAVRDPAALACEVPTRKYPDGRTGTAAGYLAHWAIGQPSCDACIEGGAAAQRARVAADPDHNLNINLRSNYQLSLDQYRRKLREQGGKCAICGTEAFGDVRNNRFHVDHDHSCCPGKKSCGKCIRGLLCRDCNTGIGILKDSPDLLMSAAAYLLSYTNVLEVADA